MDWNLFWIFVALNIVNVVIQTVKSIATIKCGKTLAAVVNAIAYGLYTVVVVYTVCDLSLWLKVVVVGLANLVGVFVVKWIEEKGRKDKLWKVEATITKNTFLKYESMLANFIVPHNYAQTSDEHIVINFFCSTSKQSEAVKNILKDMNAKFFVSESKTL